MQAPLARFAGLARATGNVVAAALVTDLTVRSTVPALLAFHCVQSSKPVQAPRQPSSLFLHIACHIYSQTSRILLTVERYPAALGLGGKQVGVNRVSTMTLRALGRDQGKVWRAL